MKSTGDTECPPHVEHACIIKDAINDKVRTHDLEDGEIVDATDDSEDSNADDKLSGDDSDGSSSDDLSLPPPPKKYWLAKQLAIPMSHRGPTVPLSSMAHC